MNQFINLGVLFIFLFSLLGCNSEDLKNEPIHSEINDDKILELKKLDTINLNSGEHMFGKFRESLRVNSSGDILSFADDDNQLIYLFDRQGNMINFLGGEGSGPEEFLKISGYFVDNERVVVIDESQLLVKMFNIEGTLIESFPLFDNQNIFINSKDIFVDADTLYVQILEANKIHDPKNSKLVARYNLSTGNIIDTIGQYDSFLDNSKHYQTRHNFDVDKKNNRLVSTLVTSPRIQVFDLMTSERTNYFVYTSEYWKDREEIIEPGMPRHEILRRATDTSYSTGIFTTDSHILNHIQILTDAWMKTSDYLSKKNYVSVYNSTGEDYIGTLELPGLLGDVYDRQLYIIEDFDPDNFKIGVYEIGIN